jgi:multidrug resistance efflux pump
MIAEAAWLAMPSLLYRTSVRAAVTAPLATVRVPRQGIVGGNPPELGATVARGQVLFELGAATPDLRPSRQASGEADSVRRAADALRAQIADLDDLKGTLKSHFNDYREARVARAERQLAEQNARLDAARSRLKQAEYEHHVQGRLSSKHASSDVEQARVANTLEIARRELGVAREAAERSAIELDAARRGLFVGEADGGQDRVASLQRCDEIEIQQMALRARLAELDARRDELQARLESERQHMTGRQLLVASPASGRVWSSSLTPGLEVSPGSTALEIVDTRRLGVEAFFKESDAPQIRPGTRVEARLVGSSQVLRGRVVRVTDPASVDPDRIGQVPAASVPAGTIRAVIELDAQPDGGDPANHQHVGAPATVRVAR